MSKHQRIRLIHWNEAERAERAHQLRKAGYTVDAAPVAGMPAFKALREDPPRAIVIDLSRLPSQGRDAAVLLRKYKSTRHVPIVFVEGDADKLARIQALLPDAAYASWKRIKSSLRSAIANPPKQPVVQDSTFAAYAATPLVKKLGIKPDSVVALVGAPAGFQMKLGRLPPGVTLRNAARGRCDLILWFTRSQSAVERRIERLGELAGAGGLWVIWPKRASALQSDLTQPVVRRTGLARGLVDYKVCAVDADWTGLRFARRKSG